MISVQQSINSKDAKLILLANQELSEVTLQNGLHNIAVQRRNRRVKYDELCVRGETWNSNPRQQQYYFMF